MSRDAYWIGSCIFPASRIGWDARDSGLDYDLLKQMVAECHAVQEYQVGDFYPLTPYSLAEDAWLAWQGHRPADGAGVVQAFGRGECDSARIRLRLRELEAEARYTVRAADHKIPVAMPGGELMDAGLPVGSTQRKAALLVWYERER